VECGVRRTYRHPPARHRRHDPPTGNAGLCQRRTCSRQLFQSFQILSRHLP
jgi:hypothetical protein